MALTLLAALDIGSGPSSTSAAAQKPDTVASAIARAVVDRMGDVQVVVRQISTTVAAQNGLVATIEPGSRLGQPIRFILFAGGRRVGSAVARLEVVGPAPRARRAFARGDEITAVDVDDTSAEITRVLLRRVPDLDEVVGARARRDIMAGELLTNTVVAVPPAVRSGDDVRVFVTLGAVQVSGVGRASGSGQVGDMIRVTTPSSRRSLGARIIGRGAVEISR